MSEVKQFCTFYLDQSLFGIEVLKVQEVVQCQATTAVPLAPECVRGLMNLRGSIVSSIDLRRRFGMQIRAGDAEPIHIVTQTSGGLVSFDVDRIGDVVEVTESEFEAPPATLSGGSRHMVQCVYKLKTGLLQVLNLERVLEINAALA